MKNNSIGKMLHRVENQIRRKMDSIAAGYGMTIVQHIVLDYLWDHESDVFQKDIENAFDVRRSSVSNVLGLLEKKGYIQRRCVSQDARLKKIFLTEEGAAVYQAVRQEIRAVEQSLEEAFTGAQERELFLDMLRRLSARIQDV